jgi:prepilin-type N-terminal cleavage/methylation domain-containing protein
MRSSGIQWKTGRRGFTLVELAIVLTIAGILIGFAMPRIQDAYKQREVNGVRDGVVMLAAVARSRAMEQAETVTFTLDTGNGIAAVLDSGDTVEVLKFTDDAGVSAEADSTTIRLCYGPRGFAVSPCSTTLGGTMDVMFSRGSYEAAVEVWPLGQLRKP